jgi:hypothetical protein
VDPASAAAIAACAAKLEKKLAELGVTDQASSSQLFEALKEMHVVVGQSANYSPKEGMEAYMMFLERGVKVTYEGRSGFVSFFLGPKEQVKKSLL